MKAGSLPNFESLLKALNEDISLPENETAGPVDEAFWKTAGRMAAGLALGAALTAGSADAGESKKKPAASSLSDGSERGKSRIGTIDPKLISALIEVESEWDPSKIGDGGKAKGLLQIHPEVITDYNRLTGSNLKHDDAFDVETAVKVCETYLNHYGGKYNEKENKPPTLRVLAKIWNGGPNGWMKDATVEYAEKVMAAYGRSPSTPKKGAVDGWSAIVKHKNKSGKTRVAGRFDEMVGAILKERSSDESFYKYVDLKDSAMREFIREFSANPDGRQKWEVIPAERMIAVWRDYAKHRAVRDQETVEDMAFTMARNTAKLEVNTEMSGHTQSHPGDLWRDYHGEELDPAMEDKIGDFILDDKGVLRVTDAGLDKLIPFAVELLSDESPEEKLVDMDRMLQICHLRGDLAANYVEGGARTLDALFSPEERPSGLSTAGDDDE